MDNGFYLYVTVQGDTFDMIALDFYNDEKFASTIIQANPQFSSTLVFPAGVELKIPIIEQAVPESLPPWKR